MAHGRLRRRLRGARPRRHRPRHSGHELHREDDAGSRRPRRSPMPTRTISARIARSLAAPRLQGLCDAFRRRRCSRPSGSPSRARPKCRSPSSRKERRIALEPFEVEFIAIAHSIPESCALAIRTPLGTVIHSGDWKIDPRARPRQADRREAPRRDRRRRACSRSSRIRPISCAKGSARPRARSAGPCASSSPRRRASSSSRPSPPMSRACAPSRRPRWRRGARSWRSAARWSGSSRSRASAAISTAFRRVPLRRRLGPY